MPHLQYFQNTDWSRWCCQHTGKLFWADARSSKRMPVRQCSNEIGSVHRLATWANKVHIHELQSPSQWRNYSAESKWRDTKALNLSLKTQWRENSKTDHDKSDQSQVDVQLAEKFCSTDRCTLYMAFELMACELLWVDYCEHTVRNILLRTKKRDHPARNLS